MSSHSFRFRCPRCHNENAFAEALLSGEEHGQCSVCGHLYSVTPDRQKTVYGGYGISFVKTNKGIGSQVSFDRPMSFQKRLQMMQRAARKNTTNHVSFTYKDRGKWKEVVLKDDSQRPVFGLRAAH